MGMPQALQRVSNDRKKHAPPNGGACQTIKELHFEIKHVGAITDRPPKNMVFRISRREITKFSPCGDRFCLGKICGRSMIAPTEHFFDKLTRPAIWRGVLHL